MEYCVDNDILKDILLVKKKEVEDIMMTVFSQEQAMEFVLKARYREGIKQGIEQGKSMGKYENSLQIVKKMKDSKMDNELIMKFTGLSEDEVSKL
ncbi:RpnC/YadD family protein [Catonella massiliensis]|uniref:Transposase n=1 Tax=Catonella massiliensis TaxID=2799636 RepID=A0ABS1J3N7_9FIRM|nr:hypothetical protein [Catonella massiliensis]MBK5898767.1 hypothetical protein [Catonella massiliensis]